MTQVMDTVVKTVNFICACALNNREFVALLGKIKSEYGEKIYRTNVRWLSRGSVCNGFFIYLRRSYYSWKRRTKLLKNWMMKDG
jgi:hypothetical protein